jgi:ABC-2 type transport system ATP-binding protein
MKHTPERLIHASQLRRHYGSHTAVDGLDIELRRGDILGFLGPNGAGKSTSMRMLTGNLAPQGGRIAINGVDLLENPLEAKRSLGYLPETPPVYRELSVDEYLMFAARLNAIPKKACAAAVAQAKARCGLSDVGRRLIGNLSKGYQQRVGIAQAIIHNPMVVVLDEPTVGLDPNQIREIRALIRELGEAHSVILSTHILPEVQSLCNRVQIIHQGRTVYSDRLTHEDGRVERLQLRLEHPPEPDQLLSLDGVCEANQTEDQQFELVLGPEASVSRLAEQLVNNGWGLSALIPRQRTLEQIFVELTTGEERR